ncbi:lamin tail domain-containing protein [Halapricum hydrolyticum]|uniref:Lamin tail domain-containing protein n=1 Tax=Halapricum hydrolyticum TaxID=2979991 RepID=A0AAE3IHP5_9EURY|nr:lamin tail domain-containing protein [Halapricum hydrolyticum]MCU4719677.1 lamin tail domain-containing protein [Halapricum hydrolyticum]MCU4728600.1 lamin tail domain-containing protein [Halapricum hydrolyticum]
MRFSASRSSVVTIGVAFLVLLAGCTTTLDSGPTPSQTIDDAPQSTATPTEGSLQIHFINVGQSTAIFLESTSNETMLIDTGDYRTDGEAVLQYLQNHDVQRIDHLVTSHSDADHIGGHAAVINYFETEAEGIGAVYDPGLASSSQTYQDYLDAVETHDVDLFEVRAGDTVPFEGASIQILSPPEEYLANGARNENSIVLHVSHGSFQFLTTGDGEQAAEEYLVETYGTELNADLFKTGHHGSDSSSSPALLEATSPQVAIISSAYDSQYGHPHEEVLQRLATRDIDTYWTAVHGTIVVTSSGQSFSVATQASAPTDTLQLRQADPVEPGESGSTERRRTYTLSGDRTTSPTVTPGTTQSGVSISLSEVHADAAGSDSENLNDEYIVLKNAGDTTVDLGGWTVADAAGHEYQIPSGVTIAPGATLTIHSGIGTDNSTDLYWGSGSPIWNNAGDTVTVSNQSNEIVLTEVYS